jgi:acyl carrier protein
MKVTFDLERRIQTIISERLRIEIPAIEDDLFENGILDSLSFVDVLVALEEEFSTQIPLDRINLDEFRCIAKIAVYLSQNKSRNEVGLGRHTAV